MSHWNYRVCAKTHATNVPGMDPEVEYSIHEVYYDEAGNISGWTADPVTVGASSLKDLRDVLNLIAGALNKPVIDLDEMEQK